MAVSFCSPEEKPILEEIEAFMNKKITILEVSKSEYTETLALTEDTSNDWRKLMQEAEQENKKRKGKPFKKK